MSEWRKYTLEELADDITVGFVGSMASEYIEGGIPFLRSLNVEPLRINQNDLKYISPKFHLRIKKSRLIPGDVVIVRTGKPGACAVVPAWLSEANCSDLVIVRCGSRINNHFLAYYINTVSSGHVASHIVGAVQQHFNVGAARTLPVYLPPLDEQRAIVATLVAFDNKIELNRQMNETLEATARAIFKDWFVDFGPTRAKLAGTKPYLAQEIWNLFPEHLNDDGKPEGWTDGSLSDFTELQNGFAFKSSDWQEDGVPVVKIGSVKPAVVDLTQISFISEALAEERSNFRLNVGDVLVGLTGYVGETGRIPPTDNPPLLNQRVGRFSTSGRFSPFVYSCVRDPAFKEFAEGMGHGSAQANVSTKDLLSYPVLRPSKEILCAYESVVGPFYEMSLSNLGQMNTLASTRDLLLPKLMSGELRVREATQVVERTLASAG